MLFGDAFSVTAFSAPFEDQPAFEAFIAQAIEAEEQEADGALLFAAIGSQVAAAGQQAAMSLVTHAGPIDAVHASATQLAGGTEVFLGGVAQTHGHFQALEALEEFFAAIDQSHVPAEQGGIGAAFAEGTIGSVQALITQDAPGLLLFEGGIVAAGRPALQDLVGVFSNAVAGSIHGRTQAAQQASLADLVFVATVDQPLAVISQDIDALQTFLAAIDQAQVPVIQAATGERGIVGAIIQATEPVLQAALGAPVHGGIVQSHAIAFQNVVGYVPLLIPGTIGQTATAPVQFVDAVLPELLLTEHIAGAIQLSSAMAGRVTVRTT